MFTDDIEEPEEPRRQYVRRGTLDRQATGNSIKCGTAGCDQAMSWPGYTRLAAIRTSLRNAGWSNDVGGAWRCSPCAALAAAGATAKAHEAYANSRELFVGVVPEGIVRPAAPFVVIVAGTFPFTDVDGWVAALNRAHTKRTITLLRENGEAGAAWLARRWAEQRDVRVDTVKGTPEELLAGPPSADAVIVATPAAASGDLARIARAGGIPVWEPLAARAPVAAAQAQGTTPASTV